MFSRLLGVSLDKSFSARRAYRVAQRVPEALRQPYPWGQQAAELLSSLAPSTNAMNGLDRESLARLNEKQSLSGEIRKYLDDDSGASDQQAAP